LFYKGSSHFFDCPFNAHSLLYYHPFIARQVKNQVILITREITCLRDCWNPSPLEKSHTVPACGHFALDFQPVTAYREVSIGVKFNLNWSRKSQGNLYEN
jgi:hypothetical protein